jgi:hypothetical protein
MKENKLQSILKGWVQKIFWTWLTNVVKGFNESWHKFCSFCIDESEQNQANAQFFCSNKPFFLPTIHIEKIFNEILQFSRIR